MSLYLVSHPQTGEPFFATFDYAKAWDTLYGETVMICHPDDVFEKTLSDVEEISTWDEMKLTMGELLTPEQTETLYSKGWVRL